MRSFLKICLAGALLGLGISSHAFAYSNQMPYFCGPGQNSPTGCVQVTQGQNIGDYNLLGNNINSLLNNVLNLSNVNTGAGLPFPPEAKLFTITASSSTGADTNEDTLATYSLAANALDVNGRKLHISAHFGTGADGNNKTAKVYFGTLSCSSGTVSTNNGSINMDMWVVKTGASTQNITCGATAGTTTVSFAPQAGTQTDTSAITLKATGQNGSSVAGDISLVDYTVEFLN